MSYKISSLYMIYSYMISGAIYLYENRLRKLCSSIKYK